MPSYAAVSGRERAGSRGGPAGLLRVADASAAGALHLSGSRAGEIQTWLPLVRLAG